MTGTTDWEITPPEAVGLNAGALAAAGETLGRPQSNARAFVVIRRGKLVWEQYYHGSGAQDRHHLFSVTKSVTSALIGIALQTGALQSVDQPVLDFFPEASLSPADPWRLLTLRHLLSMTAGLIWPSRSWGGEPLVERMRRSPDWAKFILSVPVRREKIGTFNYASSASHLLSIILTRATGMSACDYARQHLFTPLGIANISSGTDWEVDPQHNSTGGWGLHLSARELARFGWLYLCQGRWEERTVLPASWVQASTQLPAGTINGYGYQWWLRQINLEPAFAGMGVGGQYLFCVPSHELVMVILSHYTHHWPDRWEVLRELLQHVEP
jgi:CubicO group peptidase (beta-lactamase class C family)